MLTFTHLPSLKTELLVYVESEKAFRDMGQSIMIAPIINEVMLREVLYLIMNMSIYSVLLAQTYKRKNYYFIVL